MYMHMHVYMHMYIYIYKYICAYVDVYVYVYVCRCIHILYTYILCIFIFRYTHTYTDRIFVHVNVHLHIQKTNIPVYLFIYHVRLFGVLIYLCSYLYLTPAKKWETKWQCIHICILVHLPNRRCTDIYGHTPHIKRSTYMHTKHTMSQNKDMDRDRHGTRIVSCQFLSLPRVVCDRMSSPSIGSPGAAKRQSAL